MNKFDKIYLSWRSGKGETRIMVGEILIEKDAVNLKYIKEGIDAAKKYGFQGYPGLSIDKMEHENVLDLFSKRLINTERSDVESLLNFWDIDVHYKNDKLYLLAMTQGITQIDNFEFLANFQFQPDLKFVSDIAGLSHTKPNLSNIKIGDALTFEKENHTRDPNAVKIFAGKEHIGYIKKGHNMVFSSTEAHKLKIKVKDIVKYLKYNQIFIEIYLPK